MRKKTDNVSNSLTGRVSKKIIAKGSRVSSHDTTANISIVNNMTESDNKTSATLQSTPQSKKTMMTQGADGRTGRAINDDVISNSGSRDRSTTPLESDLLRYLTAHISPLGADGFHDLYIGGTNFAIGRDEYLQGIVRLVKSDCPEVTDDVQSFLEAMKQAFSTVVYENSTLLQK
jgi:hypothetical protein